MKKVTKLQEKYLKSITCISVFCMEYGSGSTYNKELKILFLNKKGKIKTLTYKYSLKNIYKLFDALFLPAVFDKKIKNDIKV